MFINQVLFEGEQDMDAKLQEIMQKKSVSARQAEGCISAEIWQQHTQEGAAYALVTKWQAKAQFQAWLSADHAKRPHAPHADGARPALKKSGFQFELLED